MSLFTRKRRHNILHDYAYFLRINDMSIIRSQHSRVLMCMLCYITRKVGPCFRAPFEVNVSVILLSDYVGKSCSRLIPCPISGKCLEYACFITTCKMEQATEFDPLIINKKKQELRPLIWDISFRLALSVRSYISSTLWRFGRYFECIS